MVFHEEEEEQEEEEEEEDVPEDSDKTSPGLLRRALPQHDGRSSKVSALSSLLTGWLLSRWLPPFASSL